MSDPPSNPLLDTALALMNAAVPGMFDDPRAAWREYVRSMRYVVIEKAGGLSVDQLKMVQSYSDSFYQCSARNLIEVRKALADADLRFEPIGEAFAQANLEVLTEVGIRAHLEQLSENEQREQLKILDQLPPEETA